MVLSHDKYQCNPSSPGNPFLDPGIYPEPSYASAHTEVDQRQDGEFRKNEERDQGFFRINCQIGRIPETTADVVIAIRSRQNAIGVQMMNNMRKFEKIDGR